METITIKNRKYKLVIEYKNIKNLYLKVNGDVLKITCNRRVSKDFIYKFIRKKGKWILKKSVKSKVGINDNSIYYKGIEYKVRHVKDSSERFEISDEEIVFYTINDSEEYFLKLFYESNYQDLVNSVNKYYNFCYNSLGNYKIPRPSVGIKYYKSRWGSCNYPKAQIHLNITLVHFSEDVVKAVLLHEFVHLVYQNHSKDYYNLLLSIMPDYKEIHKELK